MKRLLRQPWVIETAAFLFASYIRIALRTIRWRYEGREHAEAVWSSGGGAIMCLWHSRISLSTMAWPAGGARQTIHALISKSADGTLIAAVMRRLGYPAVRGSRDPKRKGEAVKGGGAALREMLGLFKQGEAVAITPDGPSGPKEIMGEGAITVSRMGGVPVLLAGLATRPCIQLNTWDRAVFPLPFARGVVVWDGPVSAPRRLDASGAEALRSEWSGRLVAANARAEALLMR